MCFSNKTKVCCERVVLFIGIIEIVFGIALAAYGFIGSDHGAEIDFKNQSIPAPQTALAIGALLVGLFTIIVGMLALATAKYKHCCFTAPFMILSFLICIFALVLAFFVLLAPMWKDKTIEGLCDKTDILKGILQGKTLKSYNAMVYDNVVDKTMCQEKCPCDPNLDAATKKLFTDKMRERSQSLVWKDAADTASSFKDWTSCLNGAEMKKVYDACEADGNKKPKCKGLQEIKKTNKDFFPKLEKSLKCSGICTVPIFGQVRTVAEGPPTQECIGALIEKLAEMKGVGVVALVVGIILLVSFFAALPLCTGFKQKDEGK